MRVTLHWLPASQLINYRRAALVWCCLIGIAQTYMRELCCHVSALADRTALRSSTSCELLVPHVKTSTVEHRAFSDLFPLPLGMHALWIYGYCKWATCFYSTSSLNLSYISMVGLRAPLS